MTSIEWLDNVFWWPFWLIALGVALIWSSYPLRGRRRVLAALGTGLGGIAFSTGVGGTIFVWGVASLILTYPLVLAVSVLVWRASRPSRWLGGVSVALVNWWLLW